MCFLLLRVLSSRLSSLRTTARLNSISDLTLIFPINLFFVNKPTPRLGFPRFFRRQPKMIMNRTKFTRVSSVMWCNQVGDSNETNYARWRSELRSSHLTLFRESIETFENGLSSIRKLVFRNASFALHSYTYQHLIEHSEIRSTVSFVSMIKQSDD